MMAETESSIDHLSIWDRIRHLSVCRRGPDRCPDVRCAEVSELRGSARCACMGLDKEDDLLRPLRLVENEGCGPHLPLE